MTVSTTDSVVEYVSGGPAFPIPYRFLQDSDIEAVLVKQDGTSETLTGAQYTLSGAGSQNGGTLTSSYAAGFLGVAGASLTISRVMDPVQPTDLRNQGKFLAETHETVFDRLTMLIQQGFAGLSRALVRPIGKNYYDAQGRQIKNLGDPTENQDATTKSWVQDLIASILATGQGPINNAANVIFAGANGFIGVVQDLANKLDPLKGSRMLGHDGWTVGDRISNLKFPEQFGGNIQAWAASGGSLGINGGTYPATGEVAFPFGTMVRTFGDVVIDASAAVTVGNFPNACAVRLGGGSFSALPALSINYLKGANLLTFAAPHGLNVGDVFVIYNPTDFSYSSFRSYYRAGEYCRVAAVTSPTQVRLTKPLYAGYTAAAVNIYKMNGGKFKLEGSLKVIAPETLPTVMAVRAQRLIDFDITGLKGYSKQSSSAIELEKCFNGEGGALVAEQGLMSGTGNDYGLVFSNCQHMRMEGYFSASRHGITTGGYGDIGSVPCRDIVCRGTATTTFEGSAHAVDTHGNTEYFTFEGDIYGGFDGGGNHITVKGRVFAADDGICFYHAEMTGYDRDYSGVRCYADTNPAAASRGVVDCGGNNTSSAAADTIGGTFDCSGMVVYAPAAMSVFKIIQRNSLATDARVKLDGAQVAQAASGYESVRVTNSGGAAFARTSMTGFEAPGEAAQVHTATEVTGVSIGGFVDIPVTTAQASASAVVTFPSGIFKDPPIVTENVNTTALGATAVVCNSNTPTASSVTLTVKTGSLANFGAAGTVRVFWRASTPR
ncbi:hypothetical protein [Pseudomonas sp. 32_A]|uniref:hypothetical protein n=1 Tax=Pseudomonas sp. 32_A TaxID=2813559 RepID=UPI001A9F484E|nr:hypothetical protein [Pseudomonas sp. 32_A]